MMSLEAIKEVSREAAAKAAAENKRPFVFEDESEPHGLQRFPIPFLGDYVPEGWERTTTDYDEMAFVDKTGWGADDEPALTVRQFQDWLSERITAAHERGETVGFAIYEEGQFQVYVSEYRKE